MMTQSMPDDERKSKLGVLEDLIRYMRKLELAKDDDVKDPLAEGLSAVGEGMKEPPEDDEEPELEVAIKKGDDDEESEGEELSPFQKKMKDYFNDTDRPKVGNSMSFMMASKKPLSASEAEKEMPISIKRRKRGRPFKNKMG